jgi:hypothetical protein
MTDFNQMTWLNPPVSADVRDGALQVRSGEKTDFWQGTYYGFHRDDGAGYRFVVDWLIRLDPVNPQTTARLAASLGTWRMFDPGRQALMRGELERLSALPGLSRDTGEIVWSNDQMKSGYVTLLLDFDRLIVSTNGYIYCLDPLTGNIQWHNPLTGYGAGAPTSLVSVRGQTSQTVIEQAAAAAAAAAASHGATT